MKKNKAAFLTLISELDNNIVTLDELLCKNRTATEKLQKLTQVDEFDWAGLGYTIHNIYNLIENYFLRISKFFENNLPPDSWHKDLVTRMALDIPEVRPALLNKSDLPVINDLRAFRHVYRNIYQSELDIDKLKTINETVPHAVSIIKKTHGKYTKKLKQIIKALSED